MLVAPSFDLQLVDLALILGAMVTFLAFIWASRRLLFLIQISDTAMSLSIKKDERRAKARRERGKINSSFLKTNMTKQERDRRKKLYMLKESRATIQAQRRETRAYIARQKFIAKKSVIETRQNEMIKEAKNAELHSKINNRDYGEFMSKKYRDTMNNNPYAKVNYR